jgi:hypothetical protein
MPPKMPHSKPSEPQMSPPKPPKPTPPKPPPKFARKKHEQFKKRKKNMNLKEAYEKLRKKYPGDRVLVAEQFDTGKQDQDDGRIYYCRIGVFSGVDFFRIEKAIEEAESKRPTPEKQILDIEVEMDKARSDIARLQARADALKLKQDEARITVDIPAADIVEPGQWNPEAVQKILADGYAPEVKKLLAGENPPEEKQ